MVIKYALMTEYSVSSDGPEVIMQRKKNHVIFLSKTFHEEAKLSEFAHYLPEFRKPKKEIPALVLSA